MQEKQNKRRFILLAVLTVSTLVVFWWAQPENRLNIDRDIFTVEDIRSISKVELASDSGNVVLAFNGTVWRVNDTYQADGDMIRVLFATLQQARPKRRVASLREDSVYRALVDSGVKVALYDGEELSEQFIAGGNAGKTQAFFADPESEEVYVVTIPGYRVYVSGIFELTESEWRDKFAFRFNWRNFKSLTAEFPEKPHDNYTVSMDRNHFGIEGMQEADTAKLNTFLDDVSLLTVDQYLSEPRLSDSLLTLIPSMDIRVTDVGNRSYRLRLYDPLQSGDVLGIIENSQAALFDRRKIQPLLKPKSFFKEK